MEFTYFIGADVSKNELDFAVMRGKTILFHKQIANDPKDIAAFLKELNKLQGFNFNGAVFYPAAQSGAAYYHGWIKNSVCHLLIVSLSEPGFVG